MDAIEYLFNEEILGTYYGELAAAAIPDSLLLVKAEELRNLRTDAAYAFTWHYVDDNRLDTKATGRPYIESKFFGTWVGVHRSERLPSGWEVFSALLDKGLSPNAPP